MTVCAPTGRKRAPFATIKARPRPADPARMSRSEARREKRAFAREKLRAACTFEADGTRCSGFLVNLSPRGMFLQTRVRQAPGTELEIEVRDLGDAAFTLIARVVHRTASHRATSPVETGGMGLEVLSAPEAFYQALYALGKGQR